MNLLALHHVHRVLTLPTVYEKTVDPKLRIIKTDFRACTILCLDNCLVFRRVKDETSACSYTWFPCSLESVKNIWTFPHQSSVAEWLRDGLT